MHTLLELPAEIPAGTTVKFSRSPGEFSAADGWTLTLYLRGANVLDKAGVANGTAFDFTLTAADTTTLGPGTYQWFERASKAGDVFDSTTHPDSLKSGVLRVLRNIATAIAGDFQTFEEAQLATVEAQIASRLSKDMQSFSIETRTANRERLRELFEIRRVLKATIYAQRHPGQLGTPVYAKFTKPGIPS